MKIGDVLPVVMSFNLRNLNIHFMVLKVCNLTQVATINKMLLVRLF